MRTEVKYLYTNEENQGYPVWDKEKQYDGGTVVEYANNETLPLLFVSKN